MKLQCPAITKKNKPCPIQGEEKRNGWCHVHDPNGKFQKQCEARKYGNINKVNKKFSQQVELAEIGQRKKKNSDTRCVYIFHIGNGIYKIGLSHKWRQRIKSLKASNPWITPVAICYCRDCHFIEHGIHATYHKYRIERELFKLPIVILWDIIDRLQLFGNVDIFNNNIFQENLSEK